jgi:sugar lactone lactonase YvrE
MDTLTQRCFGQRAAAFCLALGLSGAAARADLFVSDFNNDVVDHYNSTGSLVNFSSIIQPMGVALGPDGNLYAATDADDGFGNGASIVEFNPNTGARIGTFTSHVADNSLNVPGGIAFDSSGNLYVADLQSKILVYGSSGGAHASLLTDVNLNAPASLAFDSSGVLYAADENNGSIVKYNAGVFSVLTTPGNPINVPDDVVVGTDGNLYVLDISGTSGGIYRVNRSTGAAVEIVNYATSPFFANNLAIGPGGDLFVSGIDGNSGDGEILDYGLNGSGGGVYLDLGSGTDPTYMAFSAVPEPSLVALLTVAGAALVVYGSRRRFV